MSSGSGEKRRAPSAHPPLPSLPLLLVAFGVSRTPWGLTLCAAVALAVLLASDLTARSAAAVGFPHRRTRRLFRRQL